MKKIALIATFILLHQGGAFASDAASTPSVAPSMVAAASSSAATSSALSNATTVSGSSSIASSSPTLPSNIVHGTAPSTTTSTTTSNTSSGGMFQALLGLTVVLVLMVGLAWLAKRFSPTKGGAAGSVKVVGGVNVGNRERVLVVEVGDQWVVVGVAPGRVNALATMARQESATVDTPLTETPQFANWLKKTIDKRNGHKT